MADNFPAAFLQAVVDTLLPGDAVLPGGTTAGVALKPGAHNATMLAAVAQHAHGADAFIAAGKDRRADIIGALATAQPAAFRALLMPLLQDYCDSDAVLGALGWRSEAPQPRGHALSAMDAATEERLDAVRRRGAIWRRT